MPSVAWKRLDAPGRDVCSLKLTPDGWMLEGVADFELEIERASIRYTVRCTSGFRSLGASVRGSIGARAIAFDIERERKSWILNGERVLGLDGCIDLDLGFTPATNLLPIRRLGLADGERASAPGAWLDVTRGTLEVLPQWYERRSATSYWYEAPSVGYAALLEIDTSGFVVLYPELWRVDDARRI